MYLHLDYSIQARPAEQQIAREETCLIESGFAKMREKAYFHEK